MLMMNELFKGRLTNMQFHSWGMNFYVFVNVSILAEHDVPSSFQIFCSWMCNMLLLYIYSVTHFWIATLWL